MRLVYLGLCFLMFSQPVQGATMAYSQRQCKEFAAENPPKIEVLYNYGEVKFYYDKNSAEMSELLKKTNPYHRLHNIQGLTELKPYVNIGCDVVYEGLSSGRYCVYPKNITVTVGYRPEVYMLGTLKKGTCRYNITLRHEQTHLAIGHELLREFAADLKKRLPKIVADLGVKVSSSNTTEQTEAMVKGYEKQINELFQVFIANMLERQSVLDTDENYAQESALCP